MFICNDNKIVFIAVPKTGTRTMYKILEEKYNGKLQGEHREVVPEQYRNYFTFIIKRNPYDRAASIYWAMCRRNGDKYHYKKHFTKRRLENTFLNFLKELLARRYEKMGVGHVRIQYVFYTNNINKILRFENLQEDFNNLPFVKSKIELPHLNHTTREHIPTPKKPIGHPIRPSWEEMVTAEEGKLINKIYEIDFKHLGYEMRKY